MSTEDDGRYYGQEHVEGREAQDVPDQPEADAPEGDRGGHFPGPPPNIPEFSRVVISGSYGLGCGGKQTLQYFNITLAQARQRKWDFFGFCSNTMTCYDMHGHPVWEE